MKHIVDDVRIREIKELSPPAHILREFPATEPAAATTFEARAGIHRILHGADDGCIRPACFRGFDDRFPAGLDLEGLRSYEA